MASRMKTSCCLNRIPKAPSELTNSNKARVMRIGKPAARMFSCGIVREMNPNANVARKIAISVGPATRMPRMNDSFMAEAKNITR